VRTIAVPDSSQQITVCYEDTAELRPITDVVRHFEGHFQWIPIQYVPYICLAPVSQNRGAKAASSDRSMIVKMALEDMAALSAKIENELALAALPSQGIEIVRPSGPNSGLGEGGVCLVADPERFVARAFLPTSARDKTTNVWPSDEQLEILYDWLQHHKPTRALPILTRISQSGYGDLVILPDEISKLRLECRSLADERDLADVVRKVLSLCDLAEEDQLGIVVRGQ
jgi:hypothetical protein